MKDKLWNIVVGIVISDLRLSSLKAIEKNAYWQHYIKPLSDRWNLLVLREITTRFNSTDREKDYIRREIQDVGDKIKVLEGLGRR